MYKVRAFAINTRYISIFFTTAHLPDLHNTRSYLQIKYCSDAIISKLLEVVKSLCAQFVAVTFWLLSSGVFKESVNSVFASQPPIYPTCITREATYRFGQSASLIMTYIYHQPTNKYNKFYRAISFVLELFFLYVVTLLLEQLKRFCDGKTRF